ncbi:hypothetical protein CEXT_748921 [Caerostris extrusa]|uniref:Uncharacterized protein n=1 Tax=Caerostris extrusa TaxID=172846 RepID=A0AAV4QVH7_CAEEX|nr:hypothetical protein CEXT_748921 [Caerostris extrusa]
MKATITYFTFMKNQQRSYLPSSVLGCCTVPVCWVELERSHGKTLRERSHVGHKKLWLIKSGMRHRARVLAVELVEVERAR